MSATRIGFISVAAVAIAAFVNRRFTHVNVAPFK